MTNMEAWIKNFVQQYPEYEEMENRLTMNGFADIFLDHKKIAISDCHHTISYWNIYETPTSWELLDNK